MSALNIERGLRTSSQNSPLSKPRAVYSIDQILGNHHHHHRRNINNGELTMRLIFLIFGLIHIMDSAHLRDMKLIFTAIFNSMMSSF